MAVHDRQEVVGIQVMRLIGPGGYGQLYAVHAVLPAQVLEVHRRGNSACRLPREECVPHM